MIPIGTFVHAKLVDKNESIQGIYSGGSGSISSIHGESGTIYTCENELTTIPDRYLYGSSVWLFVKRWRADNLGLIY